MSRTIVELFPGCALIVPLFAAGCMSVPPKVSTPATSEPPPAPVPLCKRGDAVTCAAQCERHDWESCTTLGMTYEDGTTIPKDLARAATAYQRGCDGGSARGCADLGVFYENGDGVAADAAHAVSLYARSCDAGFARGCTNLGWMYESGTGAAKDAGKAFALYTKACDAGHPRGCSNLGNLYIRGDVVGNAGLGQDVGRRVAEFGQRGTVGHRDRRFGWGSPLSCRRARRRKLKSGAMRY